MDALNLRTWLDSHGPLGCHEAAFVGSVCASSLLRRHATTRRWTLRHLDSAHIVRRESAQWIWVPGNEASAAHPVTERDVVRALGRLLYEALVGADPGAEDAASTPLRRHRPDLPLAFDAVVARALAGETSLNALAAECQQQVGASPQRIRVPASLACVAVLAVIAAVLGVFASRARPAPYVATGLASAAAWESAYGLTWMDEQSAAATFVGGLLRQEILDTGPDTPTAWWLQLWVAWLKQQAGDALTAEQLGTNAARRLVELLGAAHPRAQAAAVVYSSVLQQRGAQVHGRGSVDDLVRAHAETCGIRVGEGRPSERLGEKRMDRDRDGDGLADGLELLLGTSPDARAVPGELYGALPLRGLAMPLGPAHVVAHVRGARPHDEGFHLETGPSAERWLSVMPSVQRGYAERYGWVLVARPGTGPCTIEIDTGSPPRRLRLEIERPLGPAHRTAGEAELPVVVADYEASTRRLHVWISTGASSAVAFDSLPPSGTGPYGLHLVAPRVSDTCGSVTWLLRGAAVAPM